MKTTIVNKNASILRKTALPVLIKDIHTKKIQNILARMKTALNKEDDGVAIAAPQIGESLRIFMISGRVPTILNNPLEGEPRKREKFPDAVYINPEIKKLSKKKVQVEEGCLSVRWLYGLVERSEKAIIRAYDENGKKFEKGASGLVAQIFQHEVDHLNGILFTDKAKNIENLPPTKKKTK
jgi:peptide deformylase